MMIQTLWSRLLKLILILLVFWLGALLWIFRPFLLPSFLSGTNLVILTNEFEARPCGGFITAFGEMRVFPPRATLKNSYHFEGEDLGANMAPLDQVATDMKFWDLAVDSNLGSCAERIETAYESLTGQEIAHTILLNFGTVERIFALVDPMKFEGEKVDAQTLFGVLSRSVADTDRHDEISLQKRKSPLSRFGKRVILKLFFNPFALVRSGMVIRDEMKQGDVYISGISGEVTPEAKDIVVREWNLGGAKSSRYLQKTISVNLREDLKDEWNAEVVLDVAHLGHFDEPLSTAWKGVIEIQFPEGLGGGIERIEGEIAPGESLSESFTFEDIEIPVNEDGLYEIGIFRSRGQDLLLDLTVSAYPQQQLKKGNLHIRENVGTYFGPLKKVSTCFGWKIEDDTTPPFVTLHEVVNPEGFVSPELAEKFLGYDIVGEIHFSESVYDGSDVRISLQDKNHSDRVHNDPMFGDYELLEDQRTMIVGFDQPVAQENERYFLHLKGIRDATGNEIQSGPWTLVVR